MLNVPRFATLSRNTGCRKLVLDAARSSCIWKSSTGTRPSQVGMGGSFMDRGVIYRTFSNSEGKDQSKEKTGANLFPEICYYKTLNISTNATFPQIKSAYLKLAKKLHPDVSSDPKASEKFPLLLDAYKVLSDPKQRKMYDEVIGISDPTWSEDVKFDPEFQNNEEFMSYIKGNRNYDDERKNIDFSFEEKNTEDLYDYFRAKHLGGYGKHTLREITARHEADEGGAE